MRNVCTILVNAVSLCIVNDTTNETEKSFKNY